MRHQLKKLMKNSFRYQKRQKTFKVKRNYNFEREESIIRIYKSKKDFSRSSYKERREDALALGAEEGRGKLRKAVGSRKQALIRRCPNGAIRHEKS